MFAPRSMRSVVVVLALVAGLVSGVGTADARGHSKKIGPVTGLSATATKPGAAYKVVATWNALTLATKYRVRLWNSSGTLDSGTVTSPSFTGTTTAAVNTKVTVTVTPYNGRRRGFSRSVSLTLPDLTAPTASYTLLPETADGNVTITQASLSDDVSTSAQITQVVDWLGDGALTESAPATTTTFTHDYGSTQAVYYPTVTVTDLAGNSRTYALTTVVDDAVAPTGDATVSPASAWAKWTKVRVTTSNLVDNLSLPQNVSRTVDWGDGSATQTWTGTTMSVTHVYKVGGVFNPTVTLTDQAGNASGVLPTAPVTVKVDSAAPVVRFTLPTSGRRHVSSWRTLHGRSTDAGTGVRSVAVRVIERRHGVWFAYRPVTHTWVKAASRAGAWTKSRAKAVRPTSTHTWSMRVRGLRKGLMVSKAHGTDNVGNVSAWKRHKQLLTSF